jgi:hypothetical protein
MELDMGSEDYGMAGRTHIAEHVASSTLRLETPPLFAVYDLHGTDELSDEC